MTILDLRQNSYQLSETINFNNKVIITLDKPFDIILLLLATEKSDFILYDNSLFEYFEEIKYDWQKESFVKNKFVHINDYITKKYKKISGKKIFKYKKTRQKNIF